MNIYVGNLAYTLKQEDLKEVFEQYGTVSSAHVIMDKRTGRSKGFGFVEMENKDEAQKAINALNGKDIKGRTARINEARPRDDR